MPKIDCAPGHGFLGVMPAPILYSEADARTAICYAAGLPDIGLRLRAVPRPRVIIDGRVAQAVDSTLTRCHTTETPPTWLASVDYLADASAYGRCATHGIVRIESYDFKHFVKRYEELRAQRTARAKRASQAR